MKPTLLLLVPGLVMLACGEAAVAPGASGGEGGEAGSGGEGASGGAVGSGGRGGMGGTGGAAGGCGGAGNLCGNALLDPGEECDHGNRIDFDGCSSECRIEGTCETPIPWEEASRPTLETIHPRLVLHEVQGQLRGHEAISSACGHAGRQLVYEFVSPVGGRFYLRFQNLASDRSRPRAHILRGCHGPEAAAACGVENAESFIHVPVSEGERLLLVVDAGGLATAFPFRLAAGTIAYAEAGEPCSRHLPGSTYAFCRPGTYCGSGDICEENHPPVLEEAELFRHGPDGAHLTIHASAFDQDGHRLDLGARFLDENGELLSPEPLRHVLHSSAGFWERMVDVFVDRPELADAVEAEVWVEDGLSVEPPPVLRVRLLDLPRKSSGELCDPERVRNLCERGLVCLGDPATCTEIGPLRALHCAEAMEVFPGTETDVDLAETFLPFFELPQSCIEGRAKRMAWYLPGHPTAVFRFTATRALENLHVEMRSREGSAWLDLGMMLLRRCDSVEPLACADTLPGSLDPTGHLYEELFLPSLPAGEYFVVVRSIYPTPVVPEDSRTLLITAAP